MISCRINGLRGAMGRFESMSNEATLQRQFGNLHEVMAEVEGIYRDRAPRSAQHDDVKGPRFADSFHGDATVAGYGFETELRTTDPQLAKWLREGTPPHEIRAVMASALHWVGPSGDMFAAVVHHPGTSANPWEDEAKTAAMEVLRYHGNRIGSHITAGLAGKATA